jgi:hypothetical protein
MSPEFEIVDIPPDQQPLFRALAECGVANRLILQTVVRLIEPSEALHIPASDRTELANSVIKTIVHFDGDMAAHMLRTEEGRPDPKATWKALTRAERKRARRIWDWALDPSLDTAPQGRPPKIDSTLVLYCARVLCEACGRSRFKFSRSWGDGIPGGPMWRALMAALPLAECFLARIDGAIALAPREIGSHVETIVEIVKVARSKQFEKCCRQLGLGTGANDVAEHPATFRRALMLVRAPRPRTRRS